MMLKKRGNNTLKKLDFTIGIPLVIALGTIKRLVRLIQRPTEMLTDSGIERLGVMVTTAIGDMVLTSALIRDLRAAFPTSYIVLFAADTNSIALPLLDGVDAKVILPIGNPIKAALLIRSHPVDVLIDTGQWPRINAVLSTMARAGCTVGFRTPGQYRHTSYDRIVNHRSDRHEIDNFRALLDCIDIAAGADPMLVVPTDAELPSGLQPRNFVVFHAWPSGTKSYLKEWPVERWVALGCLVAKRGFSLVLTGGSEDQEKSAGLAALLAREGITGSDFAGRISLSQTAAMLKAARAVVSVNTGIMHIAAALSAPVIGLSGPTSVRRWGPLSASAISIDAGSCSCGYLNLGFEYPDNPPDCMARISVEQVWTALVPLLSAESGNDGGCSTTVGGQART